MLKHLLYTALILFIFFSGREDEEVIDTPPIVADSVSI